MQNRILLKLFAIGVLALLLLIPLLMIRGTISERQLYRNQVLADVARSYSGEQTLSGPLLVRPYRLARWSDVDANGQRQLLWQTYQQVSAPSQLKVNGELKTEHRARGIYQALVYGSQLALQGQFELPPLPVKGADIVEVEQLDAYLAVGISDVRGMRSLPQLQWNQQTYPLAAGSRLKVIGNGVHANLGQLPDQAHNATFQLKLTLNGMGSLNLLPVGRETEVKLQAAWPHPSFIGQFLPETRQISDQGFNALWRTTWFATNADELLQQCLQGNCQGLQGSALGVRLVDPVDIYLMSERSVKYGFLFVFLIFGAFFLFEALKRLAVHPMQYGLVGLALALFFLLLLSLSEHIAFAWAYGLAAGASVGLISFYVAHVLQHAMRGLSFGALLAGLYGLLYLLLQSEDYALLLGSLLLFALLSVAMIVTRKLDWYQLGSQLSGNKTEAANI